MIPSATRRHVASIQALLGNTAQGPSYGAAVSVRGRFRPSRRRVVDREGADHVASGIFEVPAGADVSPGSRVTISGTVYTAAEIHEHSGAGPGHKEVVLIQ